MVLFTSELLAERVVPVPLDGSIVVEGAVCSTTASSQMLISVASYPPNLKK